MRALVVAIVLLAAAPASAQTTSRLSIVFGGGGNTGSLEDRYFGNAHFGFQAVVNRGPVGLGWHVLFTRSWSSNDTNVEDSLSLVEMGATLRGRFIKLRAKRPTYIVPSLGVSFVRSSIPIPPDDAQVYFGPTFGLGPEVDFGSFVLTFETRFALIASGPSAVQLLITVGVGD